MMENIILSLVIVTVLLVGGYNIRKEYLHYIQEQISFINSLSLWQLDVIHTLLTTYPELGEPVSIFRLQLSYSVPHRLTRDEDQVNEFIARLQQKGLVKACSVIDSNNWGLNLAPRRCLKLGVVPRRCLKKRWEHPEVRNRVIDQYRTFLIVAEESAAKTTS